MPVAALERVTNLLALLLETKLPLTLQEIADALGQYPDGLSAQRAAFERDKAVLRDIGVPISTEVLSGDERAGATGYRIDRRRFELDGLRLDDDERRALQVAAAAVRTDTGWTRDGLLKLGAAGDDEQARVGAHVPSTPALAALHAAASARHAVQFAYRGNVRTVDPYALMLRSGFWYLVGHDHDRGELRSFRVDRIDARPQVRDVPDSAFQVPEGFDARRALPDDPKLIGGSDVRRALVRIWPPRAALAVHELGDAAVVHRHTDGSVDVEIPFVNADALRSWVLGFDDAAELIEPPDVRDAIVAWLQSVAARGMPSGAEA